MREEKVERVRKEKFVRDINEIKLEKLGKESWN